MKKLVFLFALATAGLTSCYQAHVCPTYTNVDVEQVEEVESNENL